MRVRVLVRLKPGIMDVQGTAVRRALVGLGFTEVGEVRIGKVVELEVDAPTPERARARAIEMCEKLLANGVIEDFRFEVEEATR
jgi:phosphoribosylformylglycinamidine synthase